MNRIILLTNKLKLMEKYCRESDEQRLMASLNAVNEPLMSVITRLLTIKGSNREIVFDEALTLGALQIILDGMEKRAYSRMLSGIEIIRTELEGLCGTKYVTDCVDDEPEQTAVGGERPEQTAADGEKTARTLAVKKLLDAYFETGSDAKAFVDGLGLAPVRQAICMFGYGDGAVYRELTARAAAGSTFIVFEPETDSIVDLKAELQKNVDYYLLENLLVPIHPDYEKLYSTELVDFLKAVNENRERILVNRNTMKRFKENASRNVIANLPMLKNANLVSELSGILRRDIPVIIVSAGPSLDKNIGLLKRAKGHCLIFAVDTAMKYLMQHDIMPDLGITVEPIKPMANYEDDRCFDVPHVFDCESNPEIVSRARRRSFIYNCRDYVKRLLVNQGIEVPADVPSGGSVATAAFAVCYELQIKTVILIGQDLAYLGETTHAGGVESAGINGTIGHETVDGIDGNPVRTRSDWMGYLRWFENSIRTINEQHLDMRIIDATEGGALIHGSRVMTLEAAIDEYCTGVEYDFEKALESLPLMLEGEGLSTFEDNVKKSFEELSAVKETALKAVELCDVVISGQSAEAGKSAELLRKSADEALKQLESYRINAEASYMYPLINNYAVTDIIEEVSRLRLETGDALSEIRQNRLAFEAIVKACDYFTAVGEETGNA